MGFTFWGIPDTCRPVSEFIDHLRVTFIYDTETSFPLTSMKRCPFFLECPDGFYGNNCTVECGHCAHDVACDPVTGSCPNGCGDGYHGTNCSQGIGCTLLTSSFCQNVKYVRFIVNSIRSRKYRNVSFLTFLKLVICMGSWLNLLHSFPISTSPNVVRELISNFNGTKADPTK